jgi:alpha-1,3-mannosyltransferase
VNILQISRQFPPATGGIESVTYGLCRALRQRGYRTDVATLRAIFATGKQATPTEHIDGIPVYRLPHLGTKRYPVAPAVWSLLHPFDIIHIHAIDFFVDFLALLRARHQKTIVVNTHGGIFHTRWILPVKKLYFKIMTRLSLRCVDAVICDSHHDYRLFRSIVPEQKIHIIRNGVNVLPFAAIQKHITPGLLVGIGRIFENKHVERLIDLLPALVTEFPHLRLVWIGSDQHRQIPRLRSRAEQLGIAERVHFTGLISDEQVHTWLSRAHLFVSASSYEAFGISTVEAMSSKTVPVVTPVGIHPEIVCNGKTGFLCSFEKHQAIDSFRRALSLPLDQLDQVGFQAQQAAMQYSWDTVVDAYVSIYTRLQS